MVPQSMTPEHSSVSYARGNDTRLIYLGDWSKWFPCLNLIFIFVDDFPLAAPISHKVKNCVLPTYASYLFRVTHDIR